MARQQTSVSYQARADRVTDYIYARLDEDIRAEDLAEVACLSPYHWHRIWSAMCGETLGDRVRRLRLQRAADRLANSDMPIARIAERAGYASADAFARAFKEAYGQPPGKYRENGSHVAFKVAAQAEDREGFPVSVEELPPRRCASVPHRGAYMQIDHAMGRLFAALTAQGIVAPDQAMAAVFFDDPDLVPVDALRSAAISPVAETLSFAAPLEEMTLRGGLYARLRYQGPYADMKGAYRWLLGVWLPQSGYEPDDAPIFEAYLNSPQKVAPTDLITDIHLPLRAS
ncbi:MAG: helix-turn-helix domain-containing protein [Bradyrhizobium sp.]|nr:MAG: helix-turn-helix domain-containing protein [Bradyrhizobium sp.]